MPQSKQLFGSAIAVTVPGLDGLAISGQVQSNTITLVSASTDPIAFTLNVWCQLVGTAGSNRIVEVRALQSMNATDFESFDAVSQAQSVQMSGATTRRKWLSFDILARALQLDFINSSNGALGTGNVIEAYAVVIDTQ